MMGSLEWTGNSFARYEYHTYALPIPTKAKQIMSKYRPIAPKPTLPSSPSGSNSNASLNSHSRFTTRKGNNNSGRGLSNRARRKASECSYSPSPRAQKRVKVPNIAVDLASESSQIVGIIAQGSLPADGTKTLCSSDVCFRPEKDLDFMQIAATTAFTERSASVSAGFGERFNIKETANSVGEVGMKDLSKNMEVVPEQKLPQDRQSGWRSAKYLVFPIVSGVDQQQEEARNLVTLPLLPEKPSPKDSIVGSPAGISTSIVGDRDLKSKVSYDEEEIQFRLFGRDFSIKDVGPCKSSSYESSKLTSCVSFADLLSIEKMYFGSHEPVILLLYNDNHGQDVLWSNPAYKGMVRALQCQSFTTNQPHTMIPVPFASFSCRSVSIGAVNSKAILWGFVENCTWPETERSPDHGIFYNREHKLMPDSSSSSGRHHHNHTSMEIYINAVSCMLPDGEGRTPINKSVITPQPVRPVGSCVSIENIKEANLQSSTIWKTMEEIEEHIEAETFPALVADSHSRVKCANSAYKKMVGQPECTWLESAAHYYNNKTEGSSNSLAMNRINGEIFLKHEIPLPTSAFSCCARIQWINNKGEKTAIRAPCNVMKSVISNPISCVYAWKFHTAAAFSRSCRA